MATVHCCLQRQVDLHQLRIFGIFGIFWTYSLPGSPVEIRIPLLFCIVQTPRESWSPLQRPCNLNKDANKSWNEKQRHREGKEVSEVQQWVRAELDNKHKFPASRSWLVKITPNLSTPSGLRRVVSSLIRTLPLPLRPSPSPRVLISQYQLTVCYISNLDLKQILLSPCDTERPSCKSLTVRDRMRHV